MRREGFGVHRHIQYMILSCHDSVIGCYNAMCHTGGWPSVGLAIGMAWEFVILHPSRTASVSTLLRPPARAAFGVRLRRRHV